MMKEVGKKLRKNTWRKTEGGEERREGWEGYKTKHEGREEKNFTAASEIRISRKL